MLFRSRFYNDLIWCVLDAAPAATVQMPTNRGRSVLRFLMAIRIAEFMWRGLAGLSGGVSSKLYLQASRVASALARRVGVLK